MKLILPALAIFFVFRFSFSPSPRFPGKGWELVWSDEFNGQHIDTTHWEIFRQPRRDGIWTDEAILLEDGRLVILVYERDGMFFSGALHTENTFSRLYGYWEIRCRLPREEGHWPAFWLHSPAMGENSDPKQSGAEVDIMEYHANKPDSLYHAVHWGSYADKLNSSVRQVHLKRSATGYHTFGLRWTPRKYVFYVDGKKTWTCRKGVSGKEQYLIISEEVGRWAGDIRKASLPDSLVVDYVRVYGR